MPDALTESILTVPLSVLRQEDFNIRYRSQTLNTPRHAGAEAAVFFGVIDRTMDERLPRLVGHRLVLVNERTVVAFEAALMVG